MRLFDAHCHLIPGATNLMPTGPVVAGRLLCGVGPADWPAVALAAATWPGSRAAYGLHPWWAAEAADGWLAELEQRLRADPAAWVGEIGLDQTRGDWTAQQDAFRRQLDLARRYGRPINLHGVRAWDEVVAALDADYLPGFGQPGHIAHSFAGSHQDAARLAERGGYFTVGPRSAGRDSPRERRRAAILPADRLLLESDAFLRPGVDEVEALRTVLVWLAGVRGTTVEALGHAIAANARRLFGDDPA